jgi:hypothetical protein
MVFVEDAVAAHDVAGVEANPSGLLGIVHLGK